MIAADRPRPQPPPRRGLASTSSCRVRGAATWAWVSPACEEGRGSVRAHDPRRPPPPLSPPHTHRYSTTQSRALPRRTRLLQSEVSRPVLRARVSSSNKALRSNTLIVNLHREVGRGRQPTSSEGSTSGPPARATVLNGECARAHLTPDTGYDTLHTHRVISADIKCLALWRNPRNPSAQSRRKG